jgi:hypothetical protein
MRTLGLLLLVAGVVGFFYCGDQLTRAAPLPEGEALTVRESLDYPAGRYEAGRYGSVVLGVFGILFIALPKGG